MQLTREEVMQEGSAIDLIEASANFVITGAMTATRRINSCSLYACHIRNTLVPEQS